MKDGNDAKDDPFLFSGLEPALGNHLPFLAFFAAILFTARYGGFGPSLVAVRLGAVAATYFFIPPRGSLLLPQFQDQVGLGLYFVVGIACVLFSEALQAARRRTKDAGFDAHEVKPVGPDALQRLLTNPVSNQR